MWLMKPCSNNATIFSFYEIIWMVSCSNRALKILLNINCIKRLILLLRVWYGLLNWETFFSSKTNAYNFSWTVLHVLFWWLRTRSQTKSRYLDLWVLNNVAVTAKFSHKFYWKKYYGHTKVFRVLTQYNLKMHTWL